MDDFSDANFSHIKKGLEKTPCKHKVTATEDFSIVEGDTTIFRETSLTFSNIKSVSEPSEIQPRNTSPGDFLSSKKFDFDKIVAEAKSKIRKQLAQDASPDNYKKANIRSGVLEVKLNYQPVT